MPTPPQKQGRSTSRQRLSIAVLIPLIITAVLLGPTQIRSRLTEVARLAGPYQPSAEIQAMIDQLDLTDEGERLFLSARPRASNKCRQLSPYDGEIAGCVLKLNLLFWQANVLLVDTDNDRPVFDPVVVAAHELLHVAYDDLTPAERADVHVWLDRALADNADDIVYGYISDHAAEHHGHSEFEYYDELHS